MKVEVSLGEVVDKVTILELKAARLQGEQAVANVLSELQGLRRAWASQELPPLTSLPQWPELSAINRELWEVEDTLRACEASGDFGDRFVALARSVYRLNDRRAALKRQINQALRSPLIEEKSYGS